MVNKFQQKKGWELQATKAIENLSKKSLKEAEEFLEKLLKYKKLKKLKTTFVDGPQTAIDYNDEDKVYCRFNLDGTVTGRLSCSKYEDQNSTMGVSFHTLAKTDENVDGDVHNIRSAYVSPPGYAFIAADYATMELRILAEMAQCHTMLDSFMNRRDLHNDTGTMIYGRPITKNDVERNIAKTTNFLIGYGGGPPNLAGVLNIPLKKAEWVVARWWEVYHEIRDYVDSIEQFIYDNGYVQTIFGRRRNLPNINSDDRKIVAGAIRQGVNATIQSPASDVLVCATVGFDRDLEKTGLAKYATIKANVHDSAETIAKLDRVVLKEVLELKHYHMIENPVMRKEMGIDLQVPLVSDMEIGHSFGELMEVEMENGLVTNMDEIMEYFK